MRTDYFSHTLIHPYGPGKNFIFCKYPNDKDTSNCMLKILLMQPFLRKWCECTCVCVCACTLSHAGHFETPWTVAHKAPLSMGLPRHEYCSGQPFPSPGDLPDPGIKLTSLSSPALAGRFFPTVPPVKYKKMDQIIKLYQDKRQIKLKRQSINKLIKILENKLKV